MSSPIIIVFQVVVLVGSAIMHEISHGYTAERLGDPTARNLGRLTLNPLAHLDPFGSVILPLILSLVPGGFVFGWAKPVPYDPRNLRRPVEGGALIAAAGPAMNLVLAAVFAVLSRAATANGFEVPGLLLGIITIVNVSLAVFNLIPIPPLDGSRILMAVLPRGARAGYAALERYGMWFVVLFIVLGTPFVGPAVSWLVHLFLNW